MGEGHRCRERKQWRKHSTTWHHCVIHLRTYLCWLMQLPGVVPLDAPDVPRFTHWRWINSWRKNRVATVLFFIAVKIAQLGPVLLLALLVLLVAYIAKRL